MLTLIAFLRGINMTGHNSIKMNDLTELFKNEGFTDIRTYIASGNVVFSSHNDQSGHEIGALIEKAISDRFGYNIKVMIRTVAELKNILRVNPFLGIKNFDQKKMAVIFLSHEPSESVLLNLEGHDAKTDKFKLLGKDIFIYCPDGFGKSKIYSNFFDKCLGIPGTTRNWRTVFSIVELAEKR